MGNINLNLNINNTTNKEPIYQDYFFGTMKQEEIDDLRTRFKIIDVDWFDKIKVKSAIFADEYFNSQPEKIKVIDDMAEHFETHKDKSIYTKKTNYLCNRKEKICICNVHANDFRKIYDGINYGEEKYVAWVKKFNEPF